MKNISPSQLPGAELFAKRRKKSEKWIVDEKNVKSSSTSNFASSGFGGVVPLTPPTSVSNKLPPPPPSYLPGNTKRVEQVQKMNEIQVSACVSRLFLKRFGDFDFEKGTNFSGLFWVLTIFLVKLKTNWYYSLWLV